MESNDGVDHLTFYRFLKFITPIAPTTFNVCEYHFNKNPSRIRDLRVDTLSQMLTLGNIQQGGRYLVVEETSGLLTAAILERLGGVWKCKSNLLS